MSNTLFPGRPNYTGPTKGHFAFVHHGVLFEHSHNIAERITYINAYKPLNERATRLEHLMYLDPAQIDLAACEEARGKALTAYGEAWRVHDKAWMSLGEAWRVYDKAQTAYGKARTAIAPSVLKYVNQHFPDHKWDGSTLIFPPAVQE